MTASRDRCANCEGALRATEWRGESRLSCGGCDYLWTAASLASAWSASVEPPAGARLSLTYEPNSTEHGDLVMRVGGWVRRCDTYYFALDHPVATVSAPALAARALMLQWKALVASAEEGRPCFLAFDFSDQATGWVRCVRRGRDVELRPGWSGAEGWRIYPSSCLEVATKLDDFTPAEHTSELRVEQAQLLSDIDRSLEALPEERRYGGRFELARRRRIGRMESFASRAAHPPGDGTMLPGLGLYIAVHPMADERALLEELSMTPRDCWSVDAYAALAGDVHFVQVHSARSELDLAPGLYGRGMEGADRAEVYALNLVAVLEDECVDRPRFEATLRAFRAPLETGHPPSENALTRLS